MVVDAERLLTRRADELFSDDLLVNSPINRVNDKKTLLDLLQRGIVGHVSTTIRHELMRRDGELVIVMGKRGKHIAADQAEDYIFGFTCGNDVSERDWQGGSAAQEKAPHRSGWQPQFETVPGVKRSPRSVI